MSFFKRLLKLAVVAAAVATGVGWITGTLAAAGTVLGVSVSAIQMTFIRAFVTNLILGGLSSALGKQGSSSLTQQGTTVTTREAIAPRRVVYGLTRIGGNIVFMEATDNNKYLHIIIALAGHEINSVEKVFFNDEEVVWNVSTGIVSSGTYQDVARIRYALGTDSQTAYSELVSESDGKWTTDHRLRGIASLYVRLEYNADKYPQGVPNITALVKGKKVYDPRTTTTVWSANPALCISDYLTDTRFGMSATYASEVDETALTAAANICDQDVNLAAGGTENRYELHGVFDSSATPETVLNGMLSAMAGRLTYVGGQWKIYAGAYQSPTLTFDEDDLRSGIKIQTILSRRELFNGVKGTFQSAANNYISSDFPPVISSTYASQDNGQALRNISLPFTTSPSMAQRLAKIELLRARQQITVQLPLKLNGLKAEVGDVIQVTNARMGWSSKPFEVVGSQIAFEGEVIGVNLDLRETDSSVFDWSTDEESPFDPAPNTNLPNAFSVVAPTGLSLSQATVILKDGTAQNNVRATWTASSDSFVDFYELQWKLSTDSEYNEAATTEVIFDVLDLRPTLTYNFRVRAVNVVGVRSTFDTENITLTGDGTAPSAPTSLSATGAYRTIQLAWTNPTVTDWFQTEVWRNTSNNSGTATKIGSVSASTYADSGLASGTTYYYWLKATDFSGNTSGFSTGSNATTDTESVTAATTPRSANGYIFYNLSSASAPSAPSASSFDFSTGSFGSLTANWSTSFSPPDPSTNPSTEAGSKFWAVSFRVQESTFGGAQTVTLSAVFNWQNFDGLVTYTNITTDSGTTFIDGANIKTGTIEADRITTTTLSAITATVGTLYTQSSGGRVLIDGPNNAIKAYDSSGNEAAYFGTSGAGSGTAVRGFTYVSGYTAVQGTNYVNSTSGGNYGMVGEATNGRGGVRGAGGLYGGDFAANTSISNSFDVYLGGTGTIGPFTGCHPGLLPKDAQINLGDIVCDVEVIARKGIENTVTTVSPGPGAPVGVLVSRGDLTEDNAPLAMRGEDGHIRSDLTHFMTTHDLVTFASVGEGQINVCAENGNIQIGDLLVLAANSTGKKQEDSIVRSYTVARARESVSFAGNEVQLIACIYLCG